MASTLRILFHGNCIDGLACFYLYKKAHAGHNVVGFPVSPNEERTWPQDPENIAEWDIVLLDISMPDEILRRWEATARSVRVIDHHATSEAVLTAARPASVIFSTDRCATFLTYQFLHPGRPIPDWVHMVDRIDRWKDVTFNDRAMREMLHPMAKLAVQGQLDLALQQMDSFANLSSRPVSTDLFTFILEGSARLGAKEHYLNSILSGGRPTAKWTIDEALATSWHLPSSWIGTTVFSVDTTGISCFDSTDASQMVFDRCPDVTVFVNYIKTSWIRQGHPQSKYKYCVRAREGIDLTVGGVFSGHPCAAGDVKQYEGTPLPFIIV